MKQRDIFLIAVFTFLVVVAWIGFSLYHVQATSTISPTLKERIAPIEPRFDTSTINMLKTEREAIKIIPENQPASPAGETKKEKNL